MRTTLINTILCLLIVVIGMTLSASVPSDHEEYPAVNGDWLNVDLDEVAHQLDARAAKSRFWKRTPPRRFWKRASSDSLLAQQEDKH